MSEVSELMSILVGSGSPSLPGSERGTQLVDVNAFSLHKAFLYSNLDLSNLSKENSRLLIFKEHFLKY